MEEKRDVELMRCQPLVCAGGGLMPCCYTHTRGGTTVGETNGPPSNARASSQRFGWRPSYKSAQKVDRFCVRARAPSPVRRRGDQATSRHAHSSKQQQRQSKRHRRARPNSHAPTVSGTSELQGDVHNCPVAAAPKRFEGWGDAR